jgi:tight adherence protein B
MTMLLSIGIAVAILVLFFGLERTFGYRATALDERLQRYGARRTMTIEEEFGPTIQNSSAAMAITGSVTRAIQGRSFADNLAVELARADLTWKPAEFLILQAILTVVPGLLVAISLQNPAAFVVLAIAGYFGPTIWMKQRQAARLRTFAAQLPDTITLMANTLRSGMSLLQAMEMISREAEGPTGPEFGRVVREIGLGIGPQDALLHLVRRLRSDDLDLMVTAILVQHEVGGNLSRILDTIAHTIRERVKLKGEIRAITSQQRIAGYMLSGLPVAVGGMLMIMTPKYLLSFIDPMGPWTLLPIVALAGIITGTLVMQKIVDIEV